MNKLDVPARIDEIHVSSNPYNEPVTIKEIPPYFECIGVGTDAAVFRHVNQPHMAYKVYAQDKLEKKDNEEFVYRSLGPSPYFSTFYGSGPHYIVLSFEEGLSLYDCLLQGVLIPPEVVEDVEQARRFVQMKGLNPRDIHLKNILLQHGHAKVIDVSEYVHEGNDLRWELLKQGYEEYYPLIKGKAIPLWVLETSRKWYNQTKGNAFQFDEFMRKIKRLNPFLKE
ncbi:MULTISPECIES: serine/threonine protein kinase [Pontibacillus]|uniref:Serine/threonine protein kinase n=1 Tax=Pontibacillus chungwhensis TaxID=265426 RepID=A0ABY8UY36_9BACI|nr:MULTISPECIES: serine/threonine protein kinase [Pontibacillus]MCD5325063.1 serine/threonine protein kinase [Pontibacillus sp. HN14]WIF97315.1 serine/threonine protein kinase [Pontibacillus chungwhensis]